MLWRVFNCIFLIALFLEEAPYKECALLFSPKT